MWMTCNPLSRPDMVDLKLSACCIIGMSTLLRLNIMIVMYLQYNEPQL